MNKLLRLLTLTILLSTFLSFLPLQGSAFQNQRSILSPQKLKEILINQPDFKAEIHLLDEGKRIVQVICIANKGTKSRVKMNIPPLTCIPSGDKLVPTDTTTLITQQGQLSILLFEQSRKYIKPDTSSEEADALENMYALMVKETILNDSTLRLEDGRTQIIDGHVCKVIKVIDGKNRLVMRVYAATDLKDLIIKIDFLMDDRGAMVLKDISLDVSDELFQIPTDCQNLLELEGQ